MPMEAAVVALWRACGLVRPANDPHKDIRRKQRVNPEWFLVGELDDRVIATVMLPTKGHAAGFNYLAVEPALQRRGLGQAMLARAEELMRGVKCAKINLQVVTSNAAAIAFYESIGFAQDKVLSFGKRLEVD